MIHKITKIVAHKVRKPPPMIKKRFRKPHTDIADDNIIF